MFAFVPDDRINGGGWADVVASTGVLWRLVQRESVQPDDFFPGQLIEAATPAAEWSTMGFSRRNMEDQRRQVAEKEAAARRATDTQVLEDAERLIAAWNKRQERRMPMLFSPRLALPSLRTTGFYGTAARPAALSTPSICARSIVTQTQP